MLLNAGSGKDFESDFWKVIHVYGVDLSIDMYFDQGLLAVVSFTFSKLIYDVGGDSKGTGLNF